MLKATRSRLTLCFLLGAIPFLLSPTIAQPPDPPVEVQSQVSNDVRVRVKRAYWDMPLTRGSTLNHPGKGLVIDYEAEHTHAPNSGDMQRAITAFEVQGPNGEPVSYSNLEGRNSIFLSDINPHWPSIFLNFEVQTSSDDPKLAQGRKQSELTFHNLPFPRKLGQTVALGQTRTTDWGTHITLEKIALAPLSKRNKTPYYTLTFQFEAHPQSGDLTFNLWSSRATFMNIAGEDISGLWPRRKADNDEKKPATRTKQQWEFSIPQSAFAAQDVPGGLGFRLRLEEWSPRRRQVGDFAQFHFELPLATLPDNVPTYQPPFQLTQQAGPLSITAETWRTEQPGVARLRLWARPTDDNSPTSWIIKSAQASERRQRLTPVTPPFYSPGRSGWKAKGPAQSQENSSDFRWVLEMPQEHKNPPEKHTLKLELAEVRHGAAQYKFTGLPCPQGKTIASLNRSLKSQSNAQLTVLAVGAYEDSQLPAGWPISSQRPATPTASTSAQPFLPTAQGIAVACRWTPTAGGETVQATHRITAHDDAGRLLLDQPLEMLLQTAPDKKHYDFTLFLLPPADDMTSFNLNIGVQETITTGQAQTVDISLPQRLF
jgi:hypothetical protein